MTTTSNTEAPSQAGTEAASDAATEAGTGSTTDASNEPTTETTPTTTTGDGGSNREAARYRRQLRETEAERDALREQVEGMRRAEVDRLAQQHHRIGVAALLATGTQLADLMTDSGTVNAEALKVAVERARAELGINDRSALVIPASGTGEGSPDSGASWGGVLRGQ